MIFAVALCIDFDRKHSVPAEIPTGCDTRGIPRSKITFSTGQLQQVTAPN